MGAWNHRLELAHEPDLGLPCVTCRGKWRAMTAFVLKFDMDDGRGGVASSRRRLCVEHARGTAARIGQLDRFRGLLLGREAQRQIDVR